MADDGCVDKTHGPHNKARRPFQDDGHGAALAGWLTSTLWPRRGVTYS
jgi:hypothetical protein